MEINIPIREVKIYQSEDGKRIEEHKTVKQITVEIEDSEVDNIDTSSHVYIGIASINSPMGPQEIKFPIEVDNLEDAFLNFIPTIENLMEEMQSHIIDPTDNELIL